MARLQRRVVHTVRYPARYVDNTTRRQAKLSTEAMLTADQVARGFRVSPPEEWSDGLTPIGWRVSITALV